LHLITSCHATQLNDHCLRRAVLYPAELLVQRGRHDTHLGRGRPLAAKSFVISNEWLFFSQFDRYLDVYKQKALILSNMRLPFLLRPPRIRLRFQTPRLD
jgi:hypothetical protein